MSKPVDALVAFLRVAQADLDAAQEPVVDVEHALPGDARGIDVEPEQAAHLVGGEVVVALRLDAQALGARRDAAGEAPVGAQRAAQLGVVGVGALVEHPGVDARGHEVVRRGDGVDVAGEVEVEVLHRHHLRVAAAGGAALDAEGRALRGLADAGEDALAELRAERLRETDRRGGLALAQGRGRDGGDVDVLALLAPVQPVAHVEMDLRLVAPEQLQLADLEPRLLGDLLDGPQPGGLGDLDVGRDGALDLDGHVGISGEQVVDGSDGGKQATNLLLRARSCSVAARDAGAANPSNSACFGELTCLLPQSSFTCSPRTSVARPLFEN